MPNRVIRFVANGFVANGFVANGFVANGFVANGVRTPIVLRTLAECLKSSPLRQLNPN